MNIGQKVKFKLGTKAVLASASAEFTDAVLNAEYFVTAITTKNLLVLTKDSCDQEVPEDAVRVMTKALVVSACAVEIVETKRQEFNRILGLVGFSDTKPVCIPAEKTLVLIDAVMVKDPALGMHLLNLGRQLNKESEL